jgi:putative acyl-CoA dehydrogenase
MNAPLNSAALNSAPFITDTHEVTNQVPPLANINVYANNLALREAVAWGGAAWADAWLLERGAELGAAQMIERGRIANKNPPTLKAFDATGHRIDQVEFHPSYHELMSYAKSHGGSGRPWSQPRVGAHVARAAYYMMQGGVDGGTLCPTTMTYAVIPALADQPQLKAWRDLAMSESYDPRFIPGLQKTGITFGMGMTEKQGGSDVRANATRAEYVGESEWGAEYRITGHKWFFSAVMSDAFLMLGQTGSVDKNGNPTPTCFLLPRFGPDGALNAIRIQRLKDKLGDKSNVGTEVEFWGARAWRVGAEGRGVPQIIEMATYTRLDCALGSAATMRAAFAHAAHHATHRRAFGKRLIEQPMMQAVLADLALESEAAQVLAIFLAAAFDKQDDAHATALRRLLTPVAKYWLCKRCPPLTAEAMEVWGGNGYVEDGPMAMYYRQAPLNSIWEGSGNVMGLDTLRALTREPESIAALTALLAPVQGRDARLDAQIAAIQALLANPAELEMNGRALMQGIALAVQAALLLQHAPGFVSEAFIASRLGQREWGAAFGVLPASALAHAAAIVQRAWPEAGLSA